MLPVGTCSHLFEMCLIGKKNEARQSQIKMRNTHKHVQIVDVNNLTCVGLTNCFSSLINITRACRTVLLIHLPIAESVGR